MSFGEILLIILAVLFVVFIFGRMIYRRIKGKPTGECACCQQRMEKALKEAKKVAKCTCDRF